MFDHIPLAGPPHVFRDPQFRVLPGGVQLCCGSGRSITGCITAWVLGHQIGRLDLAQAMGAGEVITVPIHSFPAVALPTQIDFELDGCEIAPPLRVHSSEDVMRILGRPPAMPGGDDAIEQSEPASADPPEAEAPIFPFDVEFDSVTPLVVCDGVVDLHARFRHWHSEALQLSPGLNGALNLGIKLCEKQSRIQHFEDRWSVEPNPVPPGTWVPTSVRIPRPVVDREQVFVIIVDMVKEHAFWFASRGHPAFQADVTFMDSQAPAKDAAEASPVAELGDGLPDAGPSAAGQLLPDAFMPAAAVADRCYRKAAPELLPAVARGLEAIRDRFGPRIAVEFAYHYILARRADPAALAEKTRFLATGQITVEEVCAQMFASDEYQNRTVITHRDPVLVLQSWACADDV